MKSWFSSLIKKLEPKNKDNKLIYYYIFGLPKLSNPEMRLFWLDLIDRKKYTFISWYHKQFYSYLFLHLTHDVPEWFLKKHWKQIPCHSSLIKHSNISEKFIDKHPDWVRYPSLLTEDNLTKLDKTKYSKEFFLRHKDGFDKVVIPGWPR